MKIFRLLSRAALAALYLRCMIDEVIIQVDNIRTLALRLMDFA
jgi:hypothetical protein